jgi:hypothetical protein
MNSTIAAGPVAGVSFSVVDVDPFTTTSYDISYAFTLGPPAPYRT